MDVEGLLHLWARLCRETVDVGYYHKQPFYTPAGYRESWPAPTSDQIDKAETLGRVLKKMAQKHPTRCQVVRMYYGAFPGARYQTKAERLRFIRNEIGVTNRDIYRHLDAARNGLEAVLEFA